MAEILRFTVRLSQTAIGRSCLNLARPWSRFSLAVLVLIALQVVGASPAQAVTPMLAPGNGRVLALKSDSTLWAWGFNGYGQLGVGDVVDRSRPVQVPISGVTEVSAGSWHSLALKSDGTVWTWGYNGAGELGLGDTVNRYSPVRVPISGVEAVAAGGYEYSFALRGDGSLWAWGWNGGGQLGLGDIDNRSSPVRMPLNDVAAVFAGVWHSLALKRDGTLWAWGSNAGGELGLGDFVDRHSPVQVPINGVVAVAAGNGQTLALKSDGTLWAWGANFRGELGLGDTIARPSPTLVPINQVTAVAADVHSLALKADGNLWAWGDNVLGALGQGDTVHRLSPVRVPISDVVAVAAAQYFTVALKSDGTLWAWGDNRTGGLGLGDTVDRWTPTQVPGFNLGGASTSANLAVSVIGPGMLTSLPPGIDCGSSCVGRFGRDAVVTLTAVPNPGFVLEGWDGACASAGKSPTCTVTLNSNTNASAHFISATPWVTPVPRTALQLAPLSTQRATNAVVITHGHKSDATGWVRSLGNSICYELTHELQISNNAVADTLQPLCHTADWDVWILDWRTKALPCRDDNVALCPVAAWRNAEGIGEDGLGPYMKDYAYQQVHFIAHSAGSNLIDAATRYLKESGSTIRIHETFFDAYDPTVTLNILGGPYSGRHFSSYGARADWVDNYVDTRNLIGADFELETTDLHLIHGYNIDVTPQDGACGITDVECRHGRPYRFYEKSLSSIDPPPDLIGDTAGMGFPMSFERHRTLESLAQQFPANGECRVVGSTCLPIAPPANISQSLQSVSATRSIDSSSGQATCLTVDCRGINLGQSSAQSTIRGASSTLAASKSIGMEVLGTPSQPASWLVLNFTTTSVVNTLSFDWRFVPGAEGLLQIYVDQYWVGNLDQRFVPAASIQPRRLFLGDLPAGTHRIAFRLDGFGAGASGVELSNVELRAAVLDDFPTGGSLPADWIQPTGSAAPWVVASDAAYAGTASLKSGAIGHNQSSALYYADNFAAGNISFARKVSSEANYDFLEFYIDGVLKNRWSGEQPWAVVSFPITAGSHTLLWRYMKDGSVASGGDAAWIDSVSLPPLTGLNIPGATVVGAGDFNGDGKADVLVYHPTEKWVAVMLMDGLTVLDSKIVGNFNIPGWNVVGSGDFNGDGKADILFYHPINKTVGVWLMNGTTRLSAGIVGTFNIPGWVMVGAGDFNGNGKADILFHHPGNNVVGAWLMDGLTRIGAGNIVTYSTSGWSVVGTGDFNADGKADILAFHPTNKEVAVLLMNGLTVTDSQVVGSYRVDGWDVVGTGDFNGDGMADTLFYHPINKTVGVWLMDGTTRIGAGIVGTFNIAGWVMVGAGDFNGDGKADILFHHPVNNVVGAWLMNGLTRIGAANIAP